MTHFQPDRYFAYEVKTKNILIWVKLGINSIACPFHNLLNTMRLRSLDQLVVYDISYLATSSVTNEKKRFMTRTLYRHLRQRRLLEQPRHRCATRNDRRQRYRRRQIGGFDGQPGLRLEQACPQQADIRGFWGQNNRFLEQRLNGWFVDERLGGLFQERNFRRGLLFGAGVDVLALDFRPVQDFERLDFERRFWPGGVDVIKLLLTSSLTVAEIKLERLSPASSICSIFCKEDLAPAWST